MKNALLLFSIISIIAVSACKKSSTTTDPVAGSNFKFTGIVAADSVIKVNDATTITAIATGDGLSYEWTAFYGTLTGSGATVAWTVCHQDKFVISCKVTDKYNHAETKNVVVRTIN
ncbi:MAG: hypothetical protein WCJ95_21000 [Mariniphaga sp.]